MLSIYLQQIMDQLVNSSVSQNTKLKFLVVRNSVAFGYFASIQIWKTTPPFPGNGGSTILPQPFYPSWEILIPVDPLNNLSHVLAISFGAGKG
jgi:hypothetical protein